MKIMVKVLNILIALSSVIFLYLFFIKFADAHEAPSGWSYDNECCHNKDCGLITKREQEGSGLNLKVYITNSHDQTGMITSQTIYKISKDDSEHACVANGRVVCIYSTEKH